MTRPASRGAHDNETSLALYDKAAQAAAAQVLGQYSTSFGLGARLLPAAMRRHVEAVYAVVRIGDEIVDTYQGDDARAVLDRFQAEVHEAMDGQFTSHVIAHAFGVTARAVGIGRELVDPYFASMAMDLERTVHDQASFDRYVHGSAEVVGEMCLAVFINTGTGPRAVDPEMRAGARRLRAAYQKVNFLRDLGDDSGRLGRSYFPGVSADTLDDAQLAALVEDCRADIEAARRTLPGLPRRARVAVATTIDIYSRLLESIAITPAAELVRTRTRVSNPTKLALAARNTVRPGS